MECTQCLCGLKDCPGALHKAQYIIGECSKGHKGVMPEGTDKCNNCIDMEKREDYIKRMEQYGKKEETEIRS